jgi:hypothetical protein
MSDSENLRQNALAAVERHRGNGAAVHDPEPPWPDDGPGPTESDDNEQGADDEGAIEHRLQWLRINHEARRRLDDETRPPIVLPPVKPLDTLLAEPDDPTKYRIESLAPTGGRIMLSAQYKAGKTTLRDNLVRAMVDGEPFFGRFTVHTPGQRLVLIDNELSENTLRRWLRDQRITNTAAVADVIRLRGRVGLFNLLDDHCRGHWATRLRDIGCDYLILDCLRPVLDALGLDESRDAGQFLVAFDALLDDAQIPDAATVHHMGHTGERSRGDSRLQDWPDAIWRIVRETDKPDSPRYFSAYGRDVDVPEGRLSFDPATRWLTYNGGTRSDAKAEAALNAVIAVLADNAEPMSGNTIEQAVPEGHSQKATREGIKLAVKRELVTVSTGPHNAKLHSIVSPCDECGMPVTSGAERHKSCLSAAADGLFE